jgi:transposase-like protein
MIYTNEKVNNLPAIGAIPMPARSTIPDELKQQVVERLLRGETTVAKVAKEHKLHPYQVQAWVGAATLKQREREADGYTITAARSKGGPARPVTEAGPARLLRDAIIGESDDEDPVRAIGEWYIRTHVLKEAGPKAPPIGKPIKE